MIHLYINKIFELSRFKKILIQILTDTIIVTLSFFLSLALRLNNFDFIVNENNWLILVFLIPLTILIYVKLGFYQSIIRYISENIILIVGFGVFLSALTMAIGSQLLELSIPRSVPFIYFTFTFIITISIRFFFKYIYMLYKFDSRQPVAIYGAGKAGRELLSALNENFQYKPVIFLDDDIELSESKINGLKIYKLDEAFNKLKKFKIKLVLLALPSIDQSNRIKIINKLEKFNLEYKTMPRMNDLINGKAQINDINNVTIEEILEREEVPSKANLMKKNILNKIVLVTGSGGSIGSELCRQILKIGPKCLIYLDNSEYSLYKIDKEIKDYIDNYQLKCNVFPILGSIQDNVFLDNLFKKFNIQTIYHAAAFKHVPLVELNIIESIKNNIFGTKLITNLSIKYCIQNFILISSDKAVRPTNYMGATKRVAELICQTASENQKKTIFSIVRFGNVMGSSGSVIPLFKDQIKKGGPVTVTHKDVTRYFMTIKEAVGLVIQAGAMSNSGDIFILDMGKPVKILNLAKRMISLYGMKPVINNSHKHKYDKKNTITIQITELRPGEKIFEELLIGNKRLETKHSRIFKAREKNIEESDLLLLLKNLLLFCNEGDLKKIKTELEKAQLDFDTTNNFSDQM